MNIDFDRIRSDIHSRKFQFLGSGAGRRVYDMGNGYVVKIAKNGFGIRQNRNEYQLSLTYQGELLAKVISVSEGYRMLIMQAAMALQGMKPVLDYFHVRTSRGLTNVPDLVDFAKKHHLVMREFIVSRNWGLIGNKPIIIDYGFIKRRRRRRFF